MLDSTQESKVCETTMKSKWNYFFFFVIHEKFCKSFWPLWGWWCGNTDGSAKLVSVSNGILILICLLERVAYNGVELGCLVIVVCFEPVKWYFSFHYLNKLNFYLTFKLGIPPSKNFISFASMKVFKNDEKCFSFHLKSSFCS